MTVARLLNLGLVAIVIAAGGCAGADTDSSASVIVDAKCGDVEREGPVRTLRTGKLCDNLSAYRLFTVDDGKFTLGDGVIPYSLNSPLFSDYAAKFRTLYVPEGAAEYVTGEILDFPVGTIISKTFSFPADRRRPDENIRLVETRLLVRLESEWKALSYLWNDAQTDATAVPLGKDVDISWIHDDGSQREAKYGVPRIQQCKECHSELVGEIAAKDIIPIGLKVKHINRDYPYADGTRNQLEKLAAAGYIANLPSDLSAEPAIVAPDDAAASVTDRARGYLDANCAHCHNRNNTADTSGLLLNIEITSPERYGVCAKATRGEGANSEHDIAPGEPDRSLIIERMRSLDSEEGMPRLGRSIVHEEGVQLVSDWISSLPGDCSGDAATAPTDATGPTATTDGTE